MTAHINTCRSETDSAHTDDFVLLAVPDGATEQTLYLVAGVIPVLTLLEDKRDNDSLR